MVILLVLIQAGVQHVILAVSYRAELLEKEMKEQEKRVSNIYILYVTLVIVVKHSKVDHQSLL